MHLMRQRVLDELALSGRQPEFNMTKWDLKRRLTLDSNVAIKSDELDSTRVKILSDLYLFTIDLIWQVQVMLYHLPSTE